MDEKLKNEAKRVMLVRERQGGKPKAVSGVDKDGNLQTVNPTQENISNLLDVNTYDSALEAFFKKFMDEANDPSRVGLSDKLPIVFMMAEDILNSLMRIDLNPQVMENYRIDPVEELTRLEGRRQEQLPQQTPIDTEYVDVTDQNKLPENAGQFQPMDVGKIDLADMERKGIRWEAIEPHLKAMSYGHKSNSLVEMSPEMEPGGVRVPTKGRVSLEEQPDGMLKVIPHYWQAKPDLDSPFHGLLLSDEVKANLAATRHAGSLVALQLKPGPKEMCFVSLDKLTNTLEALPYSELIKRETIKGSTLSVENFEKVFNGDKGLLEKFTTRNGYFRDAYIQVDAANRNFEFSFDGLDRNRYAQENKEIYRQRMGEQKGETQGTKKEPAADDTKTNMTIHRKIKGAEVHDAAYKEWSEAVQDPAKRQTVSAHYIREMKDDKGQTFNAWVRPNFEKEKFDFFKYNPKYAKSKGAEVKPAEENKTKVAVNSKGKTNEATKNVREPLKQGQQRPREYQRPPARGQSAKNKGPKVG